jgi:hypothetical protein
VAGEPPARSRTSCLQPDPAKRTNQALCPVRAGKGIPPSPGMHPILRFRLVSCMSFAANLPRVGQDYGLCGHLLVPAPAPDLTLPFQETQSLGCLGPRDTLSPPASNRGEVSLRREVESSI